MKIQPFLVLIKMRAVVCGFVLQWFLIVVCTIVLQYMYNINKNAIQYCTTDTTQNTWYMHIGFYMSTEYIENTGHRIHTELGIHTVQNSDIECIQNTECRIHTDTYVKRKGDVASMIVASTLLYNKHKRLLCVLITCLVTVQYRSCFFIVKNIFDLLLLYLASRRLLRILHSLLYLL